MSGLEGREAGARHRRESARRPRVGEAGRRHGEGRAPLFLDRRAGGGVLQRALQPAGAEVDAGEARVVAGGRGGKCGGGALQPGGRGEGQPSLRDPFIV